MIRRKRGSNNKRQGRIESKRPVTVIQVVTAMLITITITKTITRVKAYSLLRSAGSLPLAILL
jgi:hypothetical protein